MVELVCEYYPDRAMRLVHRMTDERLSLLLSCIFLPSSPCSTLCIPLAGSDITGSSRPLSTMFLTHLRRTA